MSQTAIKAANAVVEACYRCFRYAPTRHNDASFKLDVTLAIRDGRPSDLPFPDYDGLVVRVNPEDAKLIGLPHVEAFGAAWAKLSDLLDTVTRALEAALPMDFQQQLPHELRGRFVYPDTLNDKAVVEIRERWKIWAKGQAPTV